MTTKTYVLVSTKTCLLIGCDGAPIDCLRGKPALDTARTTRLAEAVFPGRGVDIVDPPADLTCTYVAGNEVVAGCFPGLAIVVARAFGKDRPSRLDPRWLDALPFRNVYLHTMHSVVDFFACAKWEEGKLVRALSVSSDRGFIEDFGMPLPFEAPFWAGQHPVVASDPEGRDERYPLPFHPLDLGEVALRAFLGFQLEGADDPSSIDPQRVRLMRFRKRSTSWWRPWS